MAEGGERDALKAVREHLDEAHAAADRLVREVHAEAEASSRAAAADVPPRGWAATDEAPPERAALPDLQALLGLLEGARRAVPPELSQQLAEALRELLLAVRALIDWYLERLEGGAAEPPPPAVEDIPLD